MSFFEGLLDLLHRDCSVEDCSAKDDWDASDDAELGAVRGVWRGVGSDGGVSAFTVSTDGDSLRVVFRNCRGRECSRA